MATCKTCWKELNPYTPKPYCNMDCQNKEKKTEWDNFVEFFNNMIQWK
jgi:hypothetical protein